MAAGQEDTSELIGTQGKLTINTQPMNNLVNIHDASGIRREIPSSYYGRFEKAFVTEANEFTGACLDNTKLPFGLSGATQAVEIACSLQESLVSGQKIFFDETGRRVEKSQL
jgi:myo-inositol 2-dehydrogenase/D-chiro-inositol 1-dehydrogenase